jgi:hypothetical protein
MNTDWQTAFIAVSALVGEPLDATLLVLGGGEGQGKLLQGLRAPSRETRARAIARIASEVAAALDRLRLG